MSRLLSVSSSRADVGILMPVWQALASKASEELHLFLTGMHQADDAPSVEGLPDSVAVHCGGADLGGAAGAGRSFLKEQCYRTSGEGFGVALWVVLESEALFDNLEHVFGRPFF